VSDVNAVGSADAAGRGPPGRLTEYGVAVGIWLLGCLVLGYVCFVVIGDRLQTWPDRFWSAVVWQLAFAGGLAVILGVILLILKVRKLPPADFGWRKAMSRSSIIFGVVLGMLYVSGVYAGILNDPAMRGVNPFEFHWIRLLLIAVGVFMATVEELMMRGVFMNSLSRGGVPTWQQIVASGACSAVYHSFHNFTWIGFIPSLVLFSMHALLYVAAGRSIVPTAIAHSMYHVLCAPYLLMFAMSQAA
jgi:membrane protease YdiL (CAAX protease family)